MAKGFQMPGIGYHRPKGIFLEDLRPGPEWLIILEALGRDEVAGLELPRLSNTTQGEIIALGDTARVETSLDVGDLVFFKPYMGGRWQFATKDGAEARVLISHMDWMVLGFKEHAA